MKELKLILKCHGTTDHQCSGIFNCWPIVGFDGSMILNFPCFQRVTFLSLAYPRYLERREGWTKMIGCVPRTKDWARFARLDLSQIYWWWDCAPGSCQCLSSRVVSLSYWLRHRSLGPVSASALVSGQKICHFLKIDSEVETGEIDFSPVSRCRFPTGFRKLQNQWPVNRIVCLSTVSSKTWPK